MAQTNNNNINSFITEWFANPEWWFNQSDDIDRYLTDKYAHLLDDKSIINPYHLVLLYDQLIRHIVRHTLSNHIISYYLNKAVSLVDMINLDELSPTEWCFAMLPLRHTNDVDKIHKVIKLSWNKLNSLTNSKDINQNDIEQIRKFIKASYERCPVNDQTEFIKKYHPTENIIYDPIKFKHFLRNCPLDKPIQIKKNHDFIQKVQEVLSIYNPSKIIMSLSGGVDSMVALWILKNLEHIFNYTIQVVTINYCNRKISDDEERFAIAWATSLGYESNVRRIEEIRREPCMQNDMRNIYESYTRNVRYSTYKTVDPDAFVVLGHNKDDCLENIFQNISHNTKYEELRGMSYLVIQDNIKFLRPLLDIPKDDIIKFANEHNIPYLPNSTPEWSQRGQIRNKIVPCLDSWNPDLIPGLYDLAKIVKEMHQITLAFINKHIELFKQTDTGGYAASIEKAVFNAIKDSEIYWKTLIDRLVLHKISKKSLKTFLDRLANISKDSKNKNINDKNTFIRCTLKKNIQVIITIKDNVNIEIVVL